MFQLANFLGWNLRIQKSESGKKTYSYYLRQLNQLLQKSLDSETKHRDRTYREVLKHMIRSLRHTVRYGPSTTNSIPQFNAVRWQNLRLVTSETNLILRWLAAVRWITRLTPSVLRLIAKGNASRMRKLKRLI